MTKLEKVRDLILCVECQPVDKTFLNSAFVQCYFPVRKHPGDVYSMKHGDVGLFLETGHILLDDGTYEKRPIPYGAKARMILAYVNNLACRSKNPNIDLGSGLRDFMKRSNIPASGQNAREIVNQIKNISTARFAFGFKYHRVKVQKRYQIVDTMIEWPVNNPNHWNPTISLSNNYMKTIMTNQVPIDMRALSALQGNPRAMDIYTWLAYRLRTINNPRGTRIPYKTLHSIFGIGIHQHKHFKNRFHTSLKQALEVYPFAIVRVDANKDYIILHHSKPPVSISY